MHFSTIDRCLLCSSFLRRWMLMPAVLVISSLTDAEELHSRRFFTDGGGGAAFLDDLRCWMLMGASFADRR